MTTLPETLYRLQIQKGKDIWTNVTADYPLKQILDMQKSWNPELYTTRILKITTSVYTLKKKAVKKEMWL